MSATAAALSTSFFPLPDHGDHQPVMLVFDPADLAIDLAYERHLDPSAPLVRATTRDTTQFWIPRPTPVFAIALGSIVYAQKHASGAHSIVIDHANGWLTVYSGLEQIFVRPSDRFPRHDTRVQEAGSLIGLLGPTLRDPLRPLRFELWRTHPVRGYEQIDPFLYMRHWRRHCDHDDSLIDPGDPWAC